MKDAVVVYVRRDGVEVGGYYLSQAELYLKGGGLLESDEGRVAGVGDWMPLAEVCRLARELAGKKKGATSGQRAVLRKRGVEVWRGIAVEEASALITAGCGENRGRWRDGEMTEEQAEHLREMGYEPDPLMTKGEAADVIDRLHADPRTDEVRFYRMLVEEGPVYQEVEKGFPLTQEEYDAVVRESWEENVCQRARELGLPVPEGLEEVARRQELEEECDALSRGCTEAVVFAFAVAAAVLLVWWWL